MVKAQGDALNPKATVLVVDNERQICELLLCYLTELDYRVAVAYDAKEALARIDGPHRLDLAIIDLLLGPGITGPELIATVVAKQIPVIAISGKLDAEAHFAELPCVGLRKPFRLSAIADLMARLLTLPTTPNGDDGGAEGH